MLTKKSGSGVLLSLVLVLYFHSPAFSEGYFGAGAGLGMSMSCDIAEPNRVGRECASTSSFRSDPSLSKGESWGGYSFRSAAVGYFFKSLPWLGFEANYSINSQNLDTAVSAKIKNNPDEVREGLRPSSLKGVVDVSHYSTVGFLLKFKPVHDETYAGFRVFGGLGFGVDILNIKGVEFLDGDRIKQRDAGREMILDLDFLLSAGIDYKIRKNAKAYGEYKYKNASFASSAFDGIVDYEFDLDESSFTFGLAHSF